MTETPKTEVGDKPTVWKRVLDAKHKADEMIGRLEQLGISEVSPTCSERRRAYKAAGLDGGAER